MKNYLKILMLMINLKKKNQKGNIQNNKNT